MEQLQPFSLLPLPKIQFGFGVSAQLGEEAARRGAQRCVLVTDRGVAAAGLMNGVLQSLESSNVKTEVFDQVEANPPIPMVHKGAEIARRFGADLVVAVGGGSSIDTAKAIAVIVTSGGTAYDYAGAERVSRPILPLIAIPTTAGTGSEVTTGAVLQEPGTKQKVVIISEQLRPVIAVCDPGLTVSMPPSVTADTGMDALTHAIESFVNTRFNPIADLAAMEAIRLVSKSLPLAYRNGSDQQSRYNMLLASLLAGIAVSNLFHGSAHAAAAPLVSRYGVSHGRACAMMLPYVMAFNVVARPDRYATVARALGAPVDGLSGHKAAVLGIDAVRKLLKTLGIPMTLREIGARSEDIPDMAQKAASDGAVKVNPRKTGAAEMELLYRQALAGIPG